LVFGVQCSVFGLWRGSWTGEKSFATNDFGKKIVCV
jgi:hypothetical protein